MGTIDTVILSLEILGTIAFTISGCQVAVRHKMDLFGMFILGLTTAVGGGVIRDVVLGATPPAMFTNPTCALVALGVSAIICINPIRKFMFNSRLIMLWADSIGLGIFTALGTAKAISHFPHNIFLAMFTGVLTGVGGGVLRDVFANEPPYIFVKHIYAVASIIGTIVYIVLVRYIERHIALFICASVVIIIRILAAHFRWKLPKLQ